MFVTSLLNVNSLKESTTIITIISNDELNADTQFEDCCSVVHNSVHNYRRDLVWLRRDKIPFPNVVVETPKE